MLEGFKKFVLRGNVLDLAVGIVMGSAFTAVVNGLLDGVLTPLIAAIFGKPDISGVGHFTINGAAFSFGTLLQAVLNFLIVAIALYFLVVLPVQRLAGKLHLDLGPAAKTIADEVALETNEVALLTEIRDLLKTGGPPPSVSQSVEP